MKIYTIKRNAERKALTYTSYVKAYCYYNAVLIKYSSNEKMEK